jgi:protease I
VDKTLDSVSVKDYDALLQPGGVASPDRLRMIPKAVQFVKDFNEQHKPMALICHGPWMLVEADIVRGDDHFLAVPEDRYPQRGR